MGIEENVVESLWDGSFVVVCESEVRPTACLLRLRRRSMCCSLKFLIVEERARPLSGGVLIHILPTLLFCAPVKSIESPYESVTLH